MKKNLLLLFTLVTAIFFLTAQTAHAQACDGVTIDPISVPDIAPVDADGNNTACSNGLSDAAYTQAELPGSSLSDVSYIIEFSNGSPIEINTTGDWNTPDEGLQVGDTVRVRAFTYDLDSINGSLGVAESLCPTLDSIFPDLMPCAEIIRLATGDPDTGDEPGLQDLGEALDLAAALTGVVILSTDSAISVLNSLNETIMPLGLAVCYNYTDAYEILINECEVDPDDLDNDGIANEDEDVDGDGDLANDDTDGDGIPNAQDSDDDGDGIETKDEDAGDTDGDGITNALDNDDDGDGIPTADEGTVDTDGDGTIDALDDDDNGDGTPTADQLDMDADSDGISDHIDLDIVGIYEEYVSIAVYPNPNSGIFTVDVNQLNEIELFNHLGQSVGFTHSGNLVSLNHADKGVYFVKIQTNNDTYISKISVK